MSNSDYGGEEQGTRPKEHLNYGEKSQNMRGDTMEQPEKSEVTRPESHTNVSDDLKQRVVEALYQNLKYDSTDIIVNIKENNCVELKGFVPDSRSMERAVECVRELGVTDVDNDLRIQLA
jgi:osmotically-inducible protein OsmY